MDSSYHLRVVLIAESEASLAVILVLSYTVLQQLCSKTMDSGYNLRVVLISESEASLAIILKLSY